MNAWTIAGIVLAMGISAGARAEVAMPELPSLDKAPKRIEADWLIGAPEAKAGVYRGAGEHEIVLTNGLIRRVFRVEPNAATVAFGSLVTGASLLRGVKSEAQVELNGEKFDVGGLLGQPDYAYLKPEWVETLTTDPKAFQCMAVEAGATIERFPWKRVRHAADLPWPPPGASLTFRYEAPESKLPGIAVLVHYEMYDGIPLLAKWISVQNTSNEAVQLNTFTSEILAAVEFSSSVDSPAAWEYPNLHVESDFGYAEQTPASARRTVYWEPDPQYTTQVNYERKSPVLLNCRLPIGPDMAIPPGECFESFRTFELVPDTTERERRGLALRTMYRVIAPWVTENPIMLHIRNAEPSAVRLAIDQCADVGAEFGILSFGSGLDMENEDPAYLAQIKELVDYAHAKGVQLGGYSLLASRHIDDENDVINKDTGKPGGAIFGNSPCVGSRWGQEYFRKLRHFFEATGMDLLEHDGSYPGDLCASTSHPGHKGLNDSLWTQWKTTSDFYHWCRAQGIFLNVPDWYMLSGSNKTGMGYREVNWSLPRDRQIILGRQNIFDGTWYKTPTMGWMFCPLVEYQGGGAAATLEPLSEHLDAYGAHLAQNFGAGVQACYRGPRWYDTDATRAVVTQWIDWFKKYRAILESDVIHVRRPDGRGLDCLLHANPQARPRGLAMVFNPLDHDVTERLALPLYFTGLTDTALIAEKDGPPREYTLDRAFNVEVEVSVPAHGNTWLLVDLK